MDKKAEWALVGAAWFLAVSVAVLGYYGLRSLGIIARPAAASASAVVDGQARCPVTGKLVTVGPNTPKVDYQGQVYYFSTDADGTTPDARTRFLMDPDSFLKSAPAH